MQTHSLFGADPIRLLIIVIALLVVAGIQVYWIRRMREEQRKRDEFEELTGHPLSKDPAKNLQAVNGAATTLRDKIQEEKTQHADLLRQAEEVQGRIDDCEEKQGRLQQLSNDFNIRAVIA